MMPWPTLKQTQREKGSVTITRPQEIAVRSQPHKPMPLSDSSAETKKRTFSVMESFSSKWYFILRWLPAAAMPVTLKSAQY